MSSPKLFLLLWVLVSSSCLVFSELLSSTTPFLLTYWCSLGLIQEILLRFYSSRVYRWALTSAIFGVSLFVLLPLVLGGLLNTFNKTSSIFFQLRPSSVVNSWFTTFSFLFLPYLSATKYDILPAMLNVAVFCSLFMFVGGAFLGYIQQRALGIRFSWWWLLTSGLVWAVGTIVFLMGVSLLFFGSGFSKNYALILALIISGAAGSFIKGISLVFLFNRERLRG